MVAMEGFPRTPILFSLKRVEELSASPVTKSDSIISATVRQKKPTDAAVEDLLEGFVPTRIMRIRRPGRVARWRRKGIRLLRRVQNLSRYRRPLIAVSLVVLVAGGGYQAGRRIVKAFTMQHEIVAAPAPIPDPFIAEEVKPIRTQRSVVARSISVPRDVLPERIERAGKRSVQDEEIPILKLSAESPPEAYRRRVRQAVYQAGEEMSASVDVAPVIQANGFGYPSSPSNLIGGIETEFSTHRDQQIHVTPGPSNR